MIKKLLLLALLPALYLTTYSQKKRSATVSETKSSEAYDELFSKVNYRLLGPWRGGRSAAVAGHPSESNTFFMGATGGGVWKTTDGGAVWKNISDKYFGGTIGAVACAPSDPSVIYVGEGEHTFRGNVAEGFGMWRSDNGGRTWTNIGLKDTRHIVKILVHPKNPDIVWVAASGHLFGPNEERGVYKTTDGGKSWRRVLYVNNLSGAADMDMEPGNPMVIYATTWRVIRTPYSLESGGEGSGLWKSTDGGESWKNISNSKGLPKNETLGIIGVAVAPSNPDKVYALMEAKSGGLYMSADAGETWTLQSSDNNIRQRAWYYTKVFVDTKNENIVYAPNVGFMRSKDAGKSWQRVSTPHGDNHDLWIDPADPDRMIVANDGGAQVSFNGGESWSTYMNQPTSQIYRVSTDNNFPYRILGAQQDNSTIRIMSRTYGGSIGEKDWSSTAGGESGYVVADPSDADIVYGGSYGGYLSKYNHRTNENRSINVWPDNPMGAGADVQKYRFQWNFPIFFSPHNPKKLYTAGNVLFSTEDEGQTWKALSPDLTTNDKSKQLSSGGPITKDNTSVEYYCTIFTAAESPYEKDLLWTGSDDGVISVSKDGGKTWENVTPKDAPKWMMWNNVEIDPYTKGGAYFIGTRYKLDDFAPYIYKTEDYGKTWKLITNGIPSLHFTRTMKADVKRKGLLYAGTEYGMYISYDDGASWSSLQLNLPPTSITDLTIKENDLIVATQGRAFWVLDDLSVLQQYNKEVVNKPLHIFSVNDAYRMAGGQSPNPPANAAMNPPNGVVINYFLKDHSDSSKVSITVRDAQGKAIRTYATDAKEREEKIEIGKGMNQFVWNMLYPGGVRVDGLILWNGTAGSPKAIPGNYSALIKSGKDSAEVKFTIKGDPNFKTSVGEYQEQFDLLVQIRDKFNEVQNAVKDIRTLRQQINEFKGKLGKDTKEIRDLMDEMNKKMTGVEEALHQTKARSSQDVLNFPIRLNDKIAGVYGVAASGYAAPSKQAKESFNELKMQADEQLKKWKAVLSEDVPKLNKMIREKEVPIIGVK